MSIIDAIKEKLGLSAEQVEALDALEVEHPDEMPEEDPSALQAVPETSDPKPPPTPAPRSPELIAMEARLRQRDKAIEELQASDKAQAGQLSVLTEERRVSQVEAQLDELVRTGILPPGGREEAFMVFNHLNREKPTVTIHSEDAEGQDQAEEKPLADVLTALLSKMAPELPTAMRGGAWEGEEVVLGPKPAEQSAFQHGTGKEEDKEVDAALVAAGAVPAPESK